MVFFVVNDYVEIVRWIKVGLYFKFVEFFSKCMVVNLFKSLFRLKFEFINYGKVVKMWYYICKIIMLIFDLFKLICCIVYGYMYIVCYLIWKSSMLI